MREGINLEQYLASRVEILNLQGGRGYDQGVRIFNCPFCFDTKGRGWLHIGAWSAGCFNLGCEAEPRLSDGAVEWVRRVEGFASRGRTWAFLFRTYPATGGSADVLLRSRATVAFADWCRRPPGWRSFLPPDTRLGALERPFVDFARTQWGVSRSTLVQWGVGYSLQGRYAWRIMLPVIMYNTLVGFQARTIHPVEPKYLTSRHGEVGSLQAECGRPAGAMLFNYDALHSGDEVLVVEGAGDVLAWHSSTPLLPAVGLLGVILTPEKLALLALKTPKRVIVGLDTEPHTAKRAQAHCTDLRAWGFPASLGEWHGGKDAGAGGRLEVLPDSHSLYDEVFQALQ